MVVLQVDSDLANKLECSVRTMKSGGYHIIAKHIPPQHLSVASGPAWLKVEAEVAVELGQPSGPEVAEPAARIFDGACMNTFRRWSGEPVELQPLPDASEPLKDVRRRIAALLGVGVWQVKLSCGDVELAALTLGEALQGSSADVSINVQASESVYRSSIDTARRSKGFIERGHVAFPKPTGIDINMMPFVMGDKQSLWKKFHAYWPLIQQSVTDLENGKIGYLTIQESAVAAGRSQRRPGLHLETPGVIMTKGKVVDVRLHWGGGTGEGETILGGLYTASTVENSCRAWDMRIDHPADVVGPLGEAEHLRDLLGEGTFLKESTLYWMTDCTPHESVPLPEGATRQYFRLVTSAVSVWYAKHSTANPLKGIGPDPEVTRILTHDKFADIANMEGPHVRDPDEVWNLAEEEWGMGMEEELLEKSLETGKLQRRP